MKTKALISFVVTIKLICVFVFAYAKCLFSHYGAHIIIYHLYIHLFGFVWVDALRPGSTAEVKSGRSVILSTLFLGKPPRGR